MRRRTFLLCGLPWFPRPYDNLAGIRFRVRNHGRSKRHYLWIHGNETTARDVLETHMKSARGKAWLTTSPERNVRLAGLQIDPNRMWSRAGAERNLRQLNPGSPEAPLLNALLLLDQKRGRFLNHLLPPAGGILIVLHNNGVGYSVKDEIAISDRTHLPKRAEPHEFFLASAPSDYDRLAAGPYNAVLQQSPKGQDDGSLSRLCARRGIRYVNLEVSLGKATVQAEMLNWLEGTLA